MFTYFNVKKILRIAILGILASVFISGCNNDKKDEWLTAYLVDSRVEGADYTTSSGGSGVTGEDGSISYKAGDLITIKVGKATLGVVDSEDIPYDRLITPFELAGYSRSTSNANIQKVINIARFLQTIDDDRFDAVITITDTMKDGFFSSVNVQTVTDFESLITTYTSIPVGSIPSEASAKNALKGSLGLTTNNVPSATLEQHYGVINDSTTGTLTASDTDDSTFVYYIVTPPSNGTVTITNSVTGAFTFTDTGGVSAFDSFQYGVQDGDDNSTPKTVTVFVLDQKTKNVIEDQTATFASTDFAFPLSGSLSNLQILSLPSASLGVLKNNGVSVVANDIVTAASIANLNFVPVANTSGTGSFTYRVYNGTEWSGTLTMNIAVVAVNDAPIYYGPTTFTVDATATAIADLNATDVDDTNSSLTFTNVGGDDNNTFILATDGTLSFVSASPGDSNGDDIYELIVRISDTNGSSVDQGITVVVGAAAVSNTAPTCSDKNITIFEDEDYTTTTALLYADADGDSVTFHKTGVDAQNGVAFLASEGNFSYSPNNNVYGTDAFQFRVYDGVAYSSTCDVNITITPVLDSPFGKNFTIQDTIRNATLIEWMRLSEFNITETNMTVSDLTIAISDQPTKGTLDITNIDGDVGANDGNVTYTPLADQSGSDEFNISVSDGDFTIVVTVGIANVDTIDANITGFYLIDADSGLTISDDQNVGIFTPSIVIKFSKDINSTAATDTAYIDIQDGGSASICNAPLTYNSTDYTLTCTVSSTLSEDSTYSIIVQNMTDHWGQTMDDNTTTFTTGDEKFLVATGQLLSQSYTNYDDGDLQKGWTKGYSDAGTDFVDDTAMELYWLDGADNNSESYTWSQAKTYCDTNVTTHEGAAVAGDWRLPTMIELQELVDHGKTSGALIASEFVYADTIKYWTSDINSTNGAWAVSFSDGNVSLETNTSTYAIRCVYETSAFIEPSLFVRKNTGVVVDTGTSLVWQDDVNTSATWENGITYCDGLSLDGRSDWRMPNINELNLITDLNNSVKIKSAFQTFDGNGSYWSSTINRKNSGMTIYSYDINISTGEIQYHDKDTTRYVRCVRGGNS